MAQVTQKMIEEICEKSSTRAVEKMMEHIGIEPGNHTEMRRDFEFLRDWRRLCEMSKRRGVVTIVTIIIGGGFTFVVAGITAWIISLK